MKRSVILCVDDEKMVLNSLKTELKEYFGAQHLFEISEDPQEALEIFENLIDDGYEIPLVISDYIMPNMRGDELLKIIHEKSPQTMTIMLTGQATTEGITNAVNWARLYRFISKPWNPKDLILTVREALKSYIQDRQLELKNQELNELNEELEKKVEKRTHEITFKNEMLEMQQMELKIKNKQITDSIKAAFLIQKALLPASEILYELFPHHFIFFKPKDIVSGDFFWCHKIESTVYFAVADCTGHGVPGAFMSMLGISLLNGIVTDSSNKTPSDILIELRRKIKILLNNEGRNKEHQDGMDIALCSINRESKQLQYAGAFNCAYIMRKNEDLEKSELIILKADRMPIGVYPTDNKPFTNHEIRLQEKDTIYLFSDGYISQFGGEKGKKLNTLRFQNLLHHIQSNSINSQRLELKNFFREWKKNEEQVDDVLVVGIKICDSLFCE